MIGPCLVLLLGGAPLGTPVQERATDPAELRLCHAVVVPADALDWASLPEDLVPAEPPPAEPKGEVVPLRKAAVLRTPVPIKEH
jgi:hypothetical protein